VNKQRVARLEQMTLAKRGVILVAVASGESVEQARLRALGAAGLAGTEADLCYVVIVPDGADVSSWGGAQDHPAVFLPDNGRESRP